ncbi:MAG: hypothetical protein ILP13_09505, partial [Lachnospiraceae bacterium]|nr:hypothetical protein [Lachnospiraceae bacterium]
MVKKRLKTDYLIIGWILFAAVWNIVAPMFGIKGISTYLYIGLIVFWMVSVFEELPDRFVRLRMELGGFMLILLFVVRVIRWQYTETGSFLDRFCWYLYYIPLLVTPVLSLAISLHIGKKNARHLPVNVLTGLCVTLCLIILTSDFHSLGIVIRYVDGAAKGRLGPVAYLSIGWYIVLSLVSFGIILGKCRVSASKKLVHIPVIAQLLGLAVWSVYYANGGSSPRIGGVSLYNIQEVEMFIFLGLWESCILIGLIPGNSMIKERDWIREGIRKSVSSKLAELRLIYDRTRNYSDEKTFREELIEMGCLGAYIKRRANLELIADKEGLLSTQELSLSIRESFEYYELAGVSTGYEETGKAEVPSLLIITAYEFFDRIMGSGLLNACYVKVLTTEEHGQIGFKMTVDVGMEPFDGTDALLKRRWIDGEILNFLGARVRVTESDDTFRFEFGAGYSVSGRLRNLLRKNRGTRRADYGLSGLTAFLSLEKEALAEKTRIHDTLGRCLLMTRRYLLYPNSVDKDALFFEWTRAINSVGETALNISGTSGGDDYEVCIRQAKSMGVDVVLEGTIPRDKQLRSVIDTAITVH